MKLFDDIWYYRHPIGANCNVYIFKDGADLDLIDTGIRKVGILSWLLREIRKDGLDVRNLRAIYHGHYHFDHVQSDTVFQRQAIRHRGQVKVFIPRPDLHRTTPRFSLIESNYIEMKTHFPNASLDMFTGFYQKGKILFEPLVKSETPSNIYPMDNGQHLSIGKRTATIHITGGHTEGHAFFHFNDADNILHTGDHDALNEFTCNWKHTLESVRLAQRLSPDNVFIGHNPAKLGHEKATGFIDSYFRQFDKIFAPMLPLFKKGQQINLTHIALRMMGWVGKDHPALMWMHMGLYAICKYFEELQIGTISFNALGEMLFQIKHEPAEVALLDIIRYGQRRT